MPQFTYTVRDHEGKRYSGVVSASDRASAEQSLTEKKLIVTRITAVRTRRNRLLALVGMDRPHIKGEDLLVFTQELGTMVDSGVPLKRALDIMVAEMESPIWRQITMDISTGLNAGHPLSQMMRQYPDVFNRLYIAMIEAGEASGRVAETLMRLSDYIEKSEETRRKITSAFYYPVIVLAVALCIATMIVLFGIPRIETLYTAFGGTLPLPTRLLIGLTNGILKSWYIILAALFALVILLAQYFRLPSVQLRMDRLKLRLYVIGPLVRRMATARLARALSHLYASGLPLLQAMQLVAGTLGNRVMEKAVQDSTQNLREGEPIAEALRHSKVLSPLALGMISAGDESGHLEKILGKLADFYESQVELSVKALASLVEPVIIVMVGIILGSVIIALAMPFFKLASLIQQ